MKDDLLEWLGIPGIVGLGLLLAALSYYLSAVLPARGELANLRAEAAQLRASLPATGTGAGSGTAAGAPLRTVGDFPELMKELTALAEQRGVAIERAAYALRDQDGQRRIEVVLPLQGAYPMLRGYLQDALALKEALTLDELTLKRQKANDPAVEATLRFSYPVASP